MGLILLAAALGLGGLLTIQAGVNAQLRSFLGPPITAGIVNFVVGLVGLATVAVLTRTSVPAAATAARVPWWAWFGGLLGATYVVSAVVLAPKLGATLFVGVLVAGQLTAAVILDHFGWLGFPEQRVTVWRLAGVVCLVAGGWLVKR
jgi:transporter family-2 protein